MDPGTLALLIPIVAILAGAYQRVTKIKADTAASLKDATGHLDDELADARADRDRLRRRVEALEAIVTSEGFDLEREARRAGITDAAGRIDPALLRDDPEGFGAEADRADRRRTR
ncbi:hypothetical protein B1759_09110 [Rubrivirga sp. SAORIC476]|uniref:hypothetical protein n=1 Tax=Rubrivirga sp. SAORIC476 TaxID=1961794 RepID=UPI000BA8D93D|nr:hypothetical protein [Rubrivirga sp. SAORIC476]PAP81468.1 hypothetical protein B1759_09110 [Rubrivirga sp. SAORIC476]